MTGTFHPSRSSEEIALASIDGGDGVGDDEAALAAAIEVVAADGAVATDFLVMPFGNPIYGRDGRGPYILRDADHAERVIAATRDFLGKCEMMIDYDHQAHYAAEGQGNQAPAAGWVKALRVAEDGIRCSVDWTPPAQAALAAREYRYISPDFRVSRESREVTRLVRAGLTNTPNFELPALAHRRGAPAGEDPDMTKITMLAATVATALGLAPEGLDEAKVLAAIGKLKADKDTGETALASVRGQLGLAGDADEASVIAAIQSRGPQAQPDPLKFVPKAGYDELAERLKALEEHKVLASVDQAVADGKIAPAMKDWAVALGRKDPAELAAYIEKSVPFAGAAQVKGDAAPEKGQITADEKVICAMTGVSEADYLKTRDEENA